MENYKTIRILPKMLILKEGLDKGMSFSDALLRANTIAESDPTLCSLCASTLTWRDGLPICPEGHNETD